MVSAIDLTQAPPRSPSDRVGGYVILGRMIDKCRASLVGALGAYRPDSALDHLLLDWKGISWAPFWTEIVAGSSDEEVARFFDDNGHERTREEIAGWCREMEALKPFGISNQREWFVRQCAPLGLDPRTTTLFEYLDADDRRHFGRRRGGAGQWSFER
jgi:hypothetical protein